ncbi:MAG: response regulator [Hyphomonadaceae bacterium]
MGQDQSEPPIVVVIEDDPIACEALALTVSDWGGEVVSGQHEDQIVGRVDGRWEQVAFVIADFDLGPQDDGVTLGRRLAARAPQARVLVLSGVLGGEAKRAAASAGFAFMAKPARAVEIISWLERV